MRLWIGLAASLGLLVACRGDADVRTTPPATPSSEASEGLGSQAPAGLTASALQDAIDRALAVSSIQLAEAVPSPQTVEIGYGTSPNEPDWTAEGFPDDGIPGPALLSTAMQTRERDANVFVNLFLIDSPPESDLCGAPWDRDRTGDPCTLAHERGRSVVTQTYTNLFEYYVVMPDFVVSAWAVTTSKDGTPVEAPLPLSRTEIADLTHGVVDELVR